MTMNFPQFPPSLASPVQPSMPVEDHNRPSGGIYRRFVKRVLDVTAVLAAAPVVVPLVAGLAHRRGA